MLISTLRDSVGHKEYRTQIKVAIIIFWPFALGKMIKTIYKKRLDNKTEL